MQLVLGRGLCLSSDIENDVRVGWWENGLAQISAVPYLIRQGLYTTIFKLSICSFTVNPRELLLKDSVEKGIGIADLCFLGTADP